MEGFRLVRKEAPPVIKPDTEESTTFYYSNFKLFNEYAELMFSKYISFKKDLQAFLGEEWHEYAQKSVFKTFNNTVFFIPGQEVFNAALETWLELQREGKHGMNVLTPIENPEKNLIISKTQSEASTSEFQEERKADSSGMQTPSEFKFDDNQGVDSFQQKIREKLASNEINEDCFKAIIQAFYVSATKVWKEMVIDFFGDPDASKNSGFLLESKKFLLNKLQTFYSTKSKMLKPILVATRRVKDYVIDQPKIKSPLHIQIPDENDLRNFNNFALNFQPSTPTTPSYASGQDEEQDLKKNFSHLKISQTNSSGSLLGKRSSTQANSVVEIKKINKKLEKLLNPNTIEFAAYYVNNMVKTANLEWQVSRNFVTNMIEVNYNKLIQLENQASNRMNELGNDVRIRFIQPAQGFYNRLMQIWIVFKTQSVDREILFTEYLEKVRSSFGNMWNEKFTGPTQNFFMTLYYEWNHTKPTEVDSEHKILQFTKKVKESTLKIWEENIIKKAEELSNKIVGPN